MGSDFVKIDHVVAVSKSFSSENDNKPSEYVGGGDSRKGTNESDVGNTTSAAAAASSKERTLSTSSSDSEFVKINIANSSSSSSSDEKIIIQSEDNTATTRTDYVDGVGGD